LYASRAVLAFGLLGFAINGVQPSLYTVSAHLYPDAVWTTGLGAAIAVGRIGGVLSTFLGAGVLSAAADLRISQDRRRHVCQIRSVSIPVA
jgi:MFS family permease